MSLMRDLAILKIGLRTMFVFRNDPDPQSRHWLAHPVTRHNVRRWNNARLPNSLRFKVRPDTENNERLRGVIVHVPCRPPPEFRRDTNANQIIEVWKRVHQLLDELCRPSQSRNYRVPPGAPTIGQRQLSQLNTVTLQRVAQ